MGLVSGHHVLKQLRGPLEPERRQPFLLMDGGVKPIDQQLDERPADFDGAP